jgi:hypothetical protein
MRPLTFREMSPAPPSPPSGRAGGVVFKASYHAGSKGDAP